MHDFRPFPCLQSGAKAVLFKHGDESVTPEVNNENDISMSSHFGLDRLDQVEKIYHKLPCFTTNYRKFPALTEKLHSSNKFPFSPLVH